MRFDILSLFPEAFAGPLDVSILGRARERGLIEVGLVDIRNFAVGKHRRVDERPYGGGPGMVMMAEPLVGAIESVRQQRSRVIYLSPQGRRLDSEGARRLADEEHIVLVCGHYEGVDQRVIDGEVDEELSIGDYVLTNGCLAALVVVDSVSRFVPGVLGHEMATERESFEGAQLEGPQYTRPPEFRGRVVPEVLLSGDHRAIEAWRKERAREKTERVRPELIGG